MIELSEYAGALVGLGIGYLLSADGRNGSTQSFLLTSSAIGAVASFGFTYSAFAKNADEHKETSSWRINISPLSLLTNNLNRNDQLLQHLNNPVISVGYRF